MKINKTKIISASVSVLVSTLLVAGVVFAVTTINATSVVIDGANPIVLEGATTDAFETTIAVTDPTAARIITLPNQTGNVLLFANANAQDQNIIFEGLTANDFETTISVTDPTADRAIVFPNVGGTVPLAAAVSVANGANTLCTTTCPGGTTCLIGFETTTAVFVGCAVATADSCLCTTP